MRADLHTTALIRPPADKITPHIARQWLARTYGPLAGLAGCGYFLDEMGVPKRDREDVRLGCARLSIDVRRIVAACVESTQSRRSIRMGFEPDKRSNPLRTRRLRALVRFEKKSPRPWRKLPVRLDDPERFTPGQLSHSTHSSRAGSKYRRLKPLMPVSMSSLQSSSTALPDRMG